MGNEPVLTYSEFKWLNKKYINRLCLNSIEENSSIGFTLEVNLNYPDDFPLAPEKLEISQNMLSTCSSSISNGYGIKIGGLNKAVPNLGNKSSSLK